jgi:phage gp29-like protein
MPRKTTKAPEPSKAAARAPARASSRSKASSVAGKAPIAQDTRPLSQQYLRLGPQNLASVSSIMREADTGYMWRLCDLFEDYRNKDCHLQTVVSRRERALADVPWQMIPASEKRRDLKIAAWVEEVLKALGGERVGKTEPRSLTETITHLNGAVFHSYSAAEVMWKRDGKYVKPVGTLPMLPRRFIYSQIDASLRWYDVMGPLTAYPGLDLLNDFPEGRFLVHRPRVNGAIGSREGLVRPLIFAALFRNWTVADWPRLGELAWKPYRIASYDKASAVDEDRIAVENAAQSITAMGWASIPQNTKLEIAYAKNRSAGDGGVHSSLAAFLAAEMSKITLGSTLTVEQGRVGSQALGSVHQDVTQAVRDADARAMEATIQRQLINPLVRLNFGPSVPIPLFRFVTEEGADLSLLADALKKLAADCGLKAIPAQWVRSTFGIPEPLVGEELIDGTLRKDLVAEDAKQAKAEEDAAKKEDEQPQDQPVEEKPEEDDPTDEKDDDGPKVGEANVEKSRRVYWLDRTMQILNLRPANWTAQARESYRSAA